MNTSKKQILWVDDEIEFLRAHIMFLEEHQYEVTKATNGDDALAMVYEKQFDLVFMDEQMPGKDGLTTMEEIKAYDPSIPVVMVTKSEEEQLMEEAWGRDVDGYLIKPVNPSQILVVCKRIFHKKTLKKTVFTSEYVKKYTKYKAKFMTNQTSADWAGLFYSLCKWDVALTKIHDEGLEATHTSHKQEVTDKFFSFIKQNYMEWIKGRIVNKMLLPSLLKENLFPQLNGQQNCALFILSGFRFDHWMAIRPLLERAFLITEKVAYSLLPSDRLYCRSSLLSGKFPRSISEDHPELWSHLNSEDYRQGEVELFKLNLSMNRLNHLAQCPFYHTATKEESSEIYQALASQAQQPLYTVLVEFEEFLKTLTDNTQSLSEVQIEEKSICDLVNMWFQRSHLYKMIEQCAAQGRKVFLVSDHGCAMVNEPIEVFCQEEKTPHPRLKMGKDISCDERNVYFIESPSQFKLPGHDSEVSYAMTRDQYYFVYPNKFQYFGSKFKGRLVSGGISVYENMVPFVELTPKTGG